MKNNNMIYGGFFNTLIFRMERTIFWHFGVELPHYKREHDMRAYRNQMAINSRRCNTGVVLKPNGEVIRYDIEYID